MILSIFKVITSCFSVLSRKQKKKIKLKIEKKLKNSTHQHIVNKWRKVVQLINKVVECGKKW